MSRIRSCTALLALASAPLALAGTPTLTELGRLIPGFSMPGHGRFAIADFDGDGRDDIVVSGVSGTALLQVFGLDAEGIVSKQSLFVPDALFARVQAVPFAGIPQLVTIATDGTVRRFAGWPLAEAHAFDLGVQQINAAAVGDVDNNGAMDVLVSSEWSVDFRAFTLASGAPLWTVQNQVAEDILLAQLDGDPALEIVLAAGPGRILDGATLSREWSYKDGFGSYLASGRFQAGSGNEFVAARDGLMVTFQSIPWSPLWDFKVFDADAVATADFDGDGIDDILLGDGQWGSIRIIDAQTHESRLEIGHGGWGVHAVDAWDPEGDGSADVVFSPWDVRFEPVALTLADQANGQVLWTLPNADRGRYQALDVGRAGAATRLIYPAGEESDPGQWVEIDALTGAPAWRSPMPFEQDDPYSSLHPRDAVYLGADADASQLVLFGEAWSAGGTRIISLDAQTHVIRWTLDGHELASLARRAAGTLALDVGGATVIAACMVSVTDARILFIDAETGAPLWESVAMPTSNQQCGMMAGRFTDAGNSLIVVVLDSELRAYDTQTRLLEWTLPVDADGASLLEQGASSREFVTYSGSVLRFHDAATRALLRSHDLGAPVTAVRQVRGDIHGLLVAAGGRLLLVDGTTGAIRHATDYLGNNLAAGNRIATADLGGGYTRVGVGSDGGVFRFGLYTGDGIFDDGFESIVD